MVFGIGRLLSGIMSLAGSSLIGSYAGLNYGTYQAVNDPKNNNLTGGKPVEFSLTFGGYHQQVRDHMKAQNLDKATLIIPLRVNGIGTDVLYEVDNNSWSYSIGWGRHRWSLVGLEK